MTRADRASTTSPSTSPRTADYDTVRGPFRTEAFATGIPASHAGIGPMGITVFADGTVLASGGANRGQLFRFPREGGQAGTPLIELPYPIFDMALDAAG